MTERARIVVAILAVLAAVAAWSQRAEARPTYFDVFTSRYGITPSDRLYACGVCHYRWTGTGGRNPFGMAVEQQLYVGKSINQSLQDIEAGDADGDGFTNVDEIMNFLTLPGYSCTNFFDAINPPLGYDTYITPMVASCLDPIDIRVAPTTVSVLADANDSAVTILSVINNGSQYPINVSSYGLQPGTHPAFSLSGPAAPLQIAVGEKVDLQVTFSPTGGVIASGTLRIVSDDPDEGTLDVPMNGIGVAHVLAPAAARASCLKSAESTFRRYGKTHLQQWSRCFAAEAAGLACDTGARDLKIAKAAARLRGKVGGAADRRCKGQNLTPFLLGFDNVCGGTCGDIALTNMPALADCLICRQDEAMRGALSAASGATPPDVPAAAGAAPASCEQRLLDEMARDVGAIQKLLGRCELANITAATPVDCATTNAADVAAVQAHADAQLARCTDTTGLAGCLFGVGADPGCLGTTAVSLGSSLVDATIPH